MKFYVNSLSVLDFPDADYHNTYIGLFDSNKFEGRGNFCGWYAMEYYLDTTLLAYGIQLNTMFRLYNPKLPFDGGVVENINTHYSEIHIGSCLWEQSFEAESIEEALKIFKSRTW